MRVRSSATIVTLFAASLAGAQTLYGGHYYQLVVEPNVSWNTSRDAAGSMRYQGWTGHLATITSQGENDFLIDFIGVGPVWIGGEQAPGSQEPDGGWGWITGESWEYTDWGVGEPNNDGGPFGNEDKLVFGSVDSGYAGWGDLPDNGGYAPIRGYVVEYEPVPEPLCLPAMVLGLCGLKGTRRKRGSPTVQYP